MEGHLSLESQQLTSLTQIRNLYNLIQLNVVDNDLESLKDIENLINLVELFVSDNKLTSLKEIKKLIKLKHLGIRRNKITSLAGLEKFINLRVLQINNNDLTAFDLSRDLPNLKELDIRNNKLESLAGIKYLSGLSFLMINNNLLKSLDGIEKLSYIAVIHAGGNKMTSIYNGVLPINSLIYLHVDDNHLETIKDAVKFPNLKCLTISGNKSSLIVEIQKFKNLTIVNYEGIKLTENTLLDFIDKKSFRLYNFWQMTVSLPEPLKRLVLQYLKQSYITDAKNIVMSHPALKLMYKDVLKISIPAIPPPDINQPLYDWVREQQDDYKHGKLSIDKVEKLNSIPLWRWTKD